MISLRSTADGLSWVAASVTGAAVLGASLAHGLIAGGVAATLQLIAGGISGLYRGRWRLSSFDESVALAGVVTAVAVVLLSVRVGSAQLGLTIAVSVLTPFLALTLMVAARGVHRLRIQRHRRRGLPHIEKVPVLVVGAGDGGTQLIRSMFGNRASTYRPVAIVDDDPEKRNLRIQGIPVRGTRADLATVASQYRASVVVIAIPSADASTIQEISAQASAAGLDVRVLPPTQELVDGMVSLSDIREVTEEDLLGRRVIETCLLYTSDAADE